MTLQTISKQCNVSMNTVHFMKKKIGLKKCKRLTDDEGIILIDAINNRLSKGMTIATLSKKYKIGIFKVNKYKKELGYIKSGRMTKTEYDNLEACIKNYTKDTYFESEKNNLTTEERCKIIAEKLNSDGFIRSKEITKLFNGRHISTSITAIERELDIQLYDDTIKELRFRKTEDSLSCDRLKYKTIRVYKSLTKYLEECREDRKLMNGQRNGQVITNERGMFRRVV